MGDSDEFGLYIHHGGKFVNLGAGRLYSGGDVVGRFRLDKDRFEYLDLEDEIKKLGYTNAGGVGSIGRARNCALHVYMNWKKQFKGVALKNMFWQAVRDAAMETRKLKIKWHMRICQRDPTRFCKAFISTCCVSDMVDNNVSETFNGYILSARGKHIIHMLEEIKSGLRERQYKKLQHVNIVTDSITLAVRKKLEKLKSQARYCTSHPGLGGKYEVSNKEDGFIVSLHERTCNCRTWEITCIPCTCYFCYSFHEGGSSHICA